MTWPEFGQLHPFAPLDQAQGYLQLIGELEDGLVEITGYDAVSLQPNAGSQGELAGLLAIRRYHESRGEGHRDVCLIPSSAHGTNAASAVMAGMESSSWPATTPATSTWRTSRAKVGEHEDRLAALMVTYPSTHGVFEVGIGELCDIVHRPAGRCTSTAPTSTRWWASPGRGGSGPTCPTSTSTRRSASPTAAAGPASGRWPCASTWRRSCPTTAVVAEAGPRRDGAGSMSAAPWGSAGILPISWTYIRLMGADGLRRATEVAVLNANYVATRLATTSRCSTRARAAWSPTSASSTCGRSPHGPASPSTTWPSGSSTTASTPRRCRSRWPGR